MREIFTTIKDDEELEKLSEALSSPIRRKVLRLVCSRSYGILELAELTGVALSTMSFHVKILREAGLIKFVQSPDKHGNEKNVSQACESIYISFDIAKSSKKRTYSISIPIGSYFDFNVTPPCSMMSSKGQIGAMDSSECFLSPRRFQAHLISFLKGYLTYRIPASEFKGRKVKSLTFSLELCSECPNYNNNWRSDIGFAINGKRAFLYKSPGDYGDRRGLLNPDWYPQQSSQYGMLKKFRIDEIGSYIDEKLVGEAKIDEFGLGNEDYFTLQIGVEPNGTHIGGINIFGKGFGDHDQDIVVQVDYE